MDRIKFFRWIERVISIERYRRIIDFVDHYIVKLVKRLDKHNVFFAGAGLAYSLLLSMIPLILIMFSILGSVLNPATIEAQVNNAIDTIVPYTQSSKILKEFIISRLPQVIQYKTLTGYLGSFGLFFTAKWLFSSMRAVLNRVFGVTKEKSAIVAILRDLGMVVLMLVFVLVSTFLLPTLRILIETADRVEFLSFFDIGYLLEIVISLASFIFIYIMFFTFYSLIPYAKLGKRVPALAAFWATFLWEAARYLFGYYVSNFLSVSNVYGAFVLVVIIITWLLYAATLFVVGAEIGQLYRERLIIRKQKKAEQVKPAK